MSVPVVYFAYPCASRPSSLHMARLHICRVLGFLRNSLYDNILPVLGLMTELIWSTMFCWMRACTAVAGIIDGAYTCCAMCCLARVG